MHRQSTSHLDISLNYRDEVQDQLTCFDASITARQCSTVSELQIARGMAHRMNDVIYYSILILSTCRIMSAKRICEVWPVVLVRENSTQLLIYLLDICIRQFSSLRMAPWRP